MTKEDAQINDIKTAIKYCLGDIQHSRERKISAFILCVCGIDTLGALCFNLNTTNTRWERFVTIYMPTYKGLDLYKRCRNNIVHSYISNEEYGLSYDPNFTVPFTKVLNPDGSKKVIINVDYFIDELAKAIDSVFIELDTHNSDVRNCAIARDTLHPVLRSKII